MYHLIEFIQIKRVKKTIRSRSEQKKKKYININPTKSKFLLTFINYIFFLFAVFFRL